MNSNSLLTVVAVVAIVVAIIYVGATNISISVPDFLNIEIKAPEGK